MRINYDANNPLQGILYYLYTKYNNEYSNYVHVSASSYNTIGQIPNHTIDFNSETYWLASGKNNEEYLTVYLPKHPIKITGYSLQTSKFDANSGYHPKKWKFGVSVDNYQYENIIEYTDNEGEIKGPYKTIYISYSYPQYVNCFRLYPINNTYSSFHGVDLSQIEIFGDIYISTFQCTHNCMAHPFVIQSLTYIMILY